MMQAQISYEELLELLATLPTAPQEAWDDVFLLIERAEDVGVRALLDYGRALYSRDVTIRYLEMALRLDWVDEESRLRVIICLIQALAYDDSYARNLALSILGATLKRYPNRKLQGQLLCLLFDEDVLFRQSAICMFEDLRDEQAVPYLAVLMDDLDNGIRYLCKRALGHINTPSAQFALYEWERRQ